MQHDFSLSDRLKHFKPSTVPLPSTDPWPHQKPYATLFSEPLPARNQTPRAKAQCTGFLRDCLTLGWSIPDLPKLEVLWWRYHDDTGRPRNPHKRQWSTNTVDDIPDEELVRRAVRNAMPNGMAPKPRWLAVMNLFALGSTFATQLCRRFGLDPDEVVKPRRTR